MKIKSSVISAILKSGFLTIALVLLCSHTLFVKFESYFLNPNENATLNLYNGSFEMSENIIARNRIRDASFISEGTRKAIKPTQWKDKDSTVTQLNFKTGKAGTYVVGISTKARNITLDAKSFNDYLKHDGVLDVLNERTKNNLLNQDAIERYEKHVKAIYQVGDIKTEDWKTVLGYPIEFVPQMNPYKVYSGERIDVLLLFDGKPLTNQLVYTNYTPTKHSHTHDKHLNKHDAEEDKHSHEHNKHHHHKHNDDTHEHSHNDETHQHDYDDSNTSKEHRHHKDKQLRTNNQGIVTVNLPKDGIYYLRTIHMTPVTNDDAITHQSKWATLTFEVTHKHHNTHDHHDHDHEREIPTWVFVLVSIITVGVLFLFFRKKNS